MRQSDKNLLLKKDNKIKMLETKLGVGSAAGKQVSDLPKPALKTQNQKQVSGGKILFGKDDSHEKYVVESIKKRPVKFQEEAPQPKQEPVPR